ncbi:hypothetical protein [Marinifilum sp.]|uniref:hypothetical protein n=1 Tax=Marinifilum sp. TaxID=2033137 RepID=UPI003BAB1D94
MILRSIVLFGLLFLKINLHGTVSVQNKMIGWIEMEGKANNLWVSAKFENLDNQTITVDYLLSTKKIGPSGNSSTSQKGKCISKPNKVISLSEARMNLNKKDHLVIKLIVYHNKKLVAQDSVVLHGENEYIKKN